MKVQSLDNRGMTFLEVIVSLVLLSLIALMFIPIFSVTTMWMKRAGDDNTAAIYVNSVIEEIRSNRNLINDTAGTPTTPTALSLESNTPTNLTSALTEIEMNPVSGFTNLYQITVTTNWTQNGQARTFTQKTVLRKDV